jgi:AcrR family transcriptional regulator
METGMDNGEAAPADRAADVATARDQTLGRNRDRPATERRILDAAQAILTGQGPSGLGVNAVARAAGVDKQLIYRYYGGLDGLLAALGERLAQWWQDKLLDGALVAPPDSYCALIEGLARRLVRILRDEPLARNSALWELSDASGPVASLAAARGRALGAWIATMRGDLRPPAGADAPAVNAVLIAGISYLALASGTSKQVIGLATDNKNTWTRIENAVVRMIRDAYEGP